MHQRDSTDFDFRTCRCFLLFGIFTAEHMYCGVLIATEMTLKYGVWSSEYHVHSTRRPSLLAKQWEIHKLIDSTYNTDAISFANYVLFLIEKTLVAG